jgi:hypothetical protein
VFLPGYTEKELVADDNKTRSYKIAPSLSVLLSSSVKATLDYRYAQANTTYQSASRYRFVNSGAHQGRAQVEGRNWFLRGFTTRDYSGGRDPQTDGSYNLGFLGAFLQARPVVNSLNPLGPQIPYAQNYFQAYAFRYNTALLTPGTTPDAAAAAAYAFANQVAPQLQPGTPEFDAARDQIIHNPTPGQGARVVLRSMLNEGSGQYTYNNPVADLTVGAAYRQFLLGSDGSLFEDRKEGDRINNYEYGAYAQATKTLLDDHLKLAAAGRIDRFQNFGTAFSPRASVVYSLEPTSSRTSAPALAGPSARPPKPTSTFVSTWGGPFCWQRARAASKAIPRPWAPPTPAFWARPGGRIGHLPVQRPEPKAGRSE